MNREIYLDYDGDTPLFDISGLPSTHMPRCVSYDSETKKYYVLHSPDGKNEYKEIELHIGENGNMQEAEIKKINFQGFIGKCSLEYLLNGEEEKIYFPEEHNNFSAYDQVTTILIKGGKKRSIHTHWVNW